MTSQDDAKRRSDPAAPARADETPCDPAARDPLDRAFQALRGTPPPALPDALAARLAADAARVVAPSAAAARRPARVAALRGATRRTSERAPRRAAFVGAVSAMAASTLLGLWLGGSGLVDPFAPDAIAPELADLELFGAGLAEEGAAELFEEAS